MKGTVGTLAGSRYSCVCEDTILVAVIFEVHIHVFVVIYGSLVINEKKFNSRFCVHALTRTNYLASCSVSAAATNLLHQ